MRTVVQPLQKGAVACGRAELGTRIRARKGWLPAGKLVCLLLLTALVVVAVGSLLLGLRWLVVTTGSMAPALNVADLVVIAPARPEEVDAGDIITYAVPREPATLVTHRVVGRTSDGRGRYGFTTKGDASSSADAFMVDGTWIQGRVVYALPKLGHLIELSRQPSVAIAFLVLPALVVLGFSDLKLKRAAG